MRSRFRVKNCATANTPTARATYNASNCNEAIISDFRRMATDDFLYCRVKLSTDFLIRVLTLHKTASGHRDRKPPASISQQSADFADELLWRTGKDHVLARRDANAFARDRVCHNALLHCERI